MLAEADISGFRKLCLDFPQGKEEKPNQPSKQTKHKAKPKQNNNKPARQRQLKVRKPNTLEE